VIPRGIAINLLIYSLNCDVNRVTDVMMTINYIIMNFRDRISTISANQNFNFFQKYSNVQYSVRNRLGG
jgi:hypothetical protein